MDVGDHGFVSGDPPTSNLGFLATSVGSRRSDLRADQTVSSLLSQKPHDFQDLTFSIA